jgi:hypothetical protein
MFVLLFGSFVFLYMLIGQIRMVFSHKEVTLNMEKALLYKLIKNRFFKWTIVAYFAAFTVFYINQAITYFGSDRAYPQAKAYAIAANTVSFWHVVGINIRLNRGFGSYLRLIRPEDKIDTQIQKVQDFFLSKMYEHIPENDGEREMWYYRYKQLHIAKIRYLPDSIHNPHPRLSNIMDGMYDTSYKLYDKPMQDKVFDKERYIPIAQMSYYLISNIAYYATYERMSYTDKVYMFREDAKLFQKEIEYAALLENVYKKIRTDSEVAKAFDTKSPYSIGLLYAALSSALNDILIKNTHEGIYPCATQVMEKILANKKAFYYWLFDNTQISFKNLSSKEQKQFKDLYFGIGINSITKYICNESFDYVDVNKIPYYHSTFLRTSKNDENFLSSLSRKYAEYIRAEELLEEKKSHQIKDK